MTNFVKDFNIEFSGQINFKKLKKLINDIGFISIKKSRLSFSHSTMIG